MELCCIGNVCPESAILCELIVQNSGLRMQGVGILWNPLGKELKCFLSLSPLNTVFLEKVPVRNSHDSN